MKRDEAVEQIKNIPLWDMIVIGGGATGLGIGLDAASRGYHVILLEKGDFAQETSSRSTKLIHGGVRYLQQGRLGFVRESLIERGYLLRNAPHIVHKLPFILPAFSPLSHYYYFAGLKLYDSLAGQLGIGKACFLSKENTINIIPNLNSEPIFGSVSYYDAQFDDARLAINLAQTIVDKGSCVINYIEVKGLLKEKGRVCGVLAQDLERGHQSEIRAKVVVNATGAFTDHVRKLDCNDVTKIIVPSQGAHIIVDRSFLDSDHALIIPNVGQGRVLFAIPWYQHVLIGTTDILLNDIPSKPKPLPEEIDYLLKSIGKYLNKKPTHDDILSSFAGIRPLIKPKGFWKSTASLGREHSISVSESKLISVTGGKWTTYRKIGEDTVDIASKIGRLPLAKSVTKDLPIHGWTKETSNSAWSFYGADEAAVTALPFSKEKLHPSLPCRPVDVVWAVRHEMGRNAEDVLSRRNRSALLNAKASAEIESQVEKIIATELEKNMQ